MRVHGNTQGGFADGSPPAGWRTVTVRLLRLRYTTSDRATVRPAVLASRSCSTRASARSCLRCRPRRGVDALVLPTKMASGATSMSGRHRPAAGHARTCGGALGQQRLARWMKAPVQIEASAPSAQQCGHGSDQGRVDRCAPSASPFTTSAGAVTPPRRIRVGRPRQESRCWIQVSNIGAGA